MYTESESSDAEFFAEGRSNVLLYAGDHYTRKTSNYFERLRTNEKLSGEQKLRLTKNHVQYICDAYVNNIIAPNPGVGFSPKNEKETHDQKVAQMHHAVWRDMHDRYNIGDRIDEWADNFVQLGEAVVKITFDPTLGPVKAYNQKMGSNGQPLYLHPYTGDETELTMEGNAAFQPAPDMKDPIHRGEFVFESVYSFNLLRPAECKDIREAEWLGIRKMTAISKLKAQFPEFAGKIKPTTDQTYVVFDAARGGYVKSKDMAMVVEYYFRPCHKYPKGYFYITIVDQILVGDELPGGVFPIIVQPFKTFATTPRGHSPIKTMRPYQAEINRGASKMAEHQITLGDDKVLIQNGTKVSAGQQLPGLRSVNYTGQEPKILPGRDGSQYLNTVTQNITELYQVMGVKEMNEDAPAQLDPYVMLFRSASLKKRFQRYIRRFENFLVEVVETALALAKVHYTDDMLVYAVGSTEQVNIPEFRSADDLHYEVKIESQSEDIESKLGHQMVINHALQYIGPQMKPEDIGKLLRAMPFGNFDESFDDMTVDYDSSVNDILALDRGEKPPVNQYDNHIYNVKRLVSRTRKADFRFLSPEIQQSYASKIQLHQQFEAQNQIALQRARQGLIPTGGYLAKCDLYVPSAADPNKKERVTLPAESIGWLVQHLQAQQAGLAPVEGMPTGAQAQMADQFTMMGGSPGAGVPSGAGNPLGMGLG